jgi:hypothetical protein
MSLLPNNKVSILHGWVTDLPLRHQGVLLAAVRGCDGQPKENSAKPLVRALRHAFMHCADAREVDQPSSFMASSFSEADLTGFLRNWDQYPMHFIQHLMHACQVIGYKHPSTDKGYIFRVAYQRIVRKLHLYPESEANMDVRLMEDRIGTYGNVFGPDGV